jgi:single-stranded DNA-binding protein
MSINKFYVSGHVGSTPQAFTSEKGEIFASFSLAEATFINGEEKTVWHQVTCGGNFTNTILNHVNAGDKLVVEGKASPHSYLTKDKNLVSQIKIWMTGFEFAGKATSKVLTAEDHPHQDESSFEESNRVNLD